MGRSDDDRPYHTLDAMRGAAALMVVLMHGPELFAPLAPGSAYLAVDFFFVLSGFVIDHAYARRLASGMSGRAFVAVRLIRLYPLYFLGLLLGVMKAGGQFALQGRFDFPGSELLAIIGLSLLILPTLAEPAPLFPLNAPAWSLFFELSTNIVYGFVFRWINWIVLGLIIAAAGAVVVMAALARGQLNLGGYPADAWVGLARATFGFFLGVALNRARVVRFRAFNAGLAWAAPAILCCLLFVDPPAAIKPFYDLAFVLLCAPCLVVLGANVEPGARSVRAFRYLGRISYAVYALHYPVLGMARGVLQALHPPAALLGATTFVGLLLGCGIIVALVDEPVRAWLHRLKRGRLAVPAG